MKFKFDILENSESGIVETDYKEIYNLDSGEIDLKTWLESDFKKIETVYPKLSSPLNVKDVKLGTSLLKGCFAMSAFAANNVEKSTNSVYILTAGVTENFGSVGISKLNFQKFIPSFCARKLTNSNIFNGKDEYLKPTDQILQSDEYKQWSTDCIIYSLFDNQSYQSSLRNIDYQNKKWDIVNEFFWQDINKLKELAETHNFMEMIDDFDNHDKQRFVYQEIEKIKNETITFSQDALNLLQFANELIVKSFPFRKLMHEQKEEYHLNAWDCGYAQLKLVWKEFLKDDFKTFDDLRKKLAENLRPKVYEFGFLYK
jgi:hypothetical protein